MSCKAQLLKKPVKARQICVASLTVLFCVSCAAQGGGTYDGTPTVLAPPHSSDGTMAPTASQEPQVLVVNRVFAPTMCDIGPALPTQGAAEKRYSLIDKNGPQQPPIFNMSSFSVTGFTRGNWPVVIDYELEHDSLLIVVIAPDGTEPLLYRLDAKKGHWQTRLLVPAQVGDRPVVAQYLVRSLEDKAGQAAAPAHMHVHGIAAGPKAVGSIGIDRVIVGPNSVRPALGERVHFAFHTMYDFKNTEVNFVRIATVNGEIIAARVARKSTGTVLKGTQKEGDWDGKRDGRENFPRDYPPQVRQWLSVPGGQHLVQVRAWWGSGEGGDWVTALSENFVTVQ